MAATKTAKKTQVKRGAKAMSDEHKAALAAGRESGRAVRAYLTALDQHKPKRGRKRTPDSVRARLTAIEDAIPDADPVKRLSLVQEKLNLLIELDSLTNTVDLSALEKDFQRYAKQYSQGKGITYAAWREIGVPADVLKGAGITRGS